LKKEKFTSEKIKKDVVRLIILPCTTTKNIAKNRKKTKTKIEFFRLICRFDNCKKTSFCKILFAGSVAKKTQSSKFDNRNR